MNHRLLLVVVVVAGALACPSVLDDRKAVTARIGAAGGELRHPAGAVLTVPPGALDHEVELSITDEEPPEASVLGGQAIGPAFVLGPEGQQFKTAVQVTLPFEPEDLPAGAAASSLRVRLSPRKPLSFGDLATTVDEARHLLTAETSHFSIVAAAAGTVPGACTGLLNSGPTVVENRVAQLAPTPQGGAVVPGVYYRTAAVTYTGPGGATGPSGRRARQTLRITGTGGNTAVLEVVQYDYGEQERRGAGTLTLSGTDFRLDQTCPSTSSLLLRYSFSGDTLEIFESRSEGIRVTTYVRQPNAPGSDGGPDGGVPGACSSVPNLGPVVEQVRVAASAPSPQGGTLTAGTFVLMDEDLYTGPGGITGVTGKRRRVTMELSTTSATTGTNQEYSERIGNTPERRAYTLSTHGTLLTVIQTCPRPNSLSVGYTVTGDDLIIFEQDLGGMRVDTYRKLAADGGIPHWDGGTPDAGGTPDGGTPDAGGTPDSGTETIATGLTDLVDLDLDDTHVYVLGNGQVRRCALAGCGSNAALVTSAFASSLAVDQGTLWLTTNYRSISTCDLSGGSCTLVQQADLGPDTFPAHLWVANGRVYWLSQSGASRLIQTCPRTGCGAGYPKTVFQGPPLDGVPVSGLVVNATDAYVLSYVGGVYRIPLTSAETANGAAAAWTVGTDYGSGGFEGDAIRLRWVNIQTGTLESCLLPGCTSVSTLASGLLTPSGLRSTATHLYGASRGTPNGSGGHVAGTASIWRMGR